MERLCQHCAKPLPAGMRRDARYCSYECRMRAYQVRLRSREGYLQRADALERKLRMRQVMAEWRRIATDPEYAHEAGLAWLRELQANPEYAVPETRAQYQRRWRWQRRG